MSTIRRDLLVRVNLTTRLKERSIHRALLALVSRLIGEGLPAHGGYQLTDESGRVIGSCDVVEREVGEPRPAPPAPVPSWHAEVCAPFNEYRAQRAGATARPW